jgi:hypothetical protein
MQSKDWAQLNRIQHHFEEELPQENGLPKDLLEDRIET